MSNGSEHLDERCVHAVDGPDWAGLREPTSWKERAIAAETERDALLAENERLRRINGHITSNYLSRSRAARDALAEREALQDRLNAMTVEWGATVVGKGPIEAESEEHARAISDGPVRSRLVGPWTVVPEGEN